MSLNNNTLSSGLVGWWTFDGKDTFPKASTPTTLDRSGQGNTGALTNGPVPTIGKIGQALKFDGVNDYAKANNSSSLDITTGSVSVCLWLKTSTNTTTTRKYVFAKEEPSVYPFQGYRIELNNTGQTQPNVIFNVKDTTGVQKNVYSSKNVNDLLWHHLCGILDRNAAQVYVYVDSTQSASASASGLGSLTNTSGAYMGLGTDGSSLPFPGSLDEVRIYSHALSAAEVKRLYNIGR